MADNTLYSAFFGRLTTKDSQTTSIAVPVISNVCNARGSNVFMPYLDMYFRFYYAGYQKYNFITWKECDREG